MAHTVVVVEHSIAQTPGRYQTNLQNDEWITTFQFQVIIATVKPTEQVLIGHAIDMLSADADLRQEVSQIFFKLSRNKLLWL